MNYVLLKQYIGFTLLFTQCLSQHNQSASAGPNPHQRGSKIEENFKPANILIGIGVGTQSHAKALLEIGQVLKNRGNSIKFASGEASKRYMKGHDFEYISLGGLEVQQDPVKEDKAPSSKKRENIVQSIAKVFTLIFGQSYKSSYPTLSKYVLENRPDVMMCDFFAHACRDVAEMNGIPLIIGVQVIDMVGITSAPYISNSLDYVPLTTDQMSFIERFNDKVYQPLKILYYLYPFINKMNEVRKIYGVPSTFTPFGNFKNTLVLANTFEGLEASSPIQPNLKIVGPIISDNFAPLTPDLSAFLDANPKTLYIAFGSRAALEDYDLENLIISSLISIENGDIDAVIWGLGKTTKDCFPATVKISGNIIDVNELFRSNHPKFRLLSWAPQTAILNHPSTKLFISHGGLESTVEAVYSGTPILNMGITGDQFRNAKKIEKLGIGLFVDRITTTPEMIRDKIAYIISDESGSISANVKKAQIMAQIGSRRKSLAADLVEEYLNIAKLCRPLNPYKMGEIACEVSHLIPASSQMSFIKANLIDVYSFSLLVFVSITSGILIALYYFVNAILLLFSKKSYILKKKEN